MLEGGISGGLVLLLAVACGATVADLCCAQPLLNTLAGASRSLRAPPGY